MSVSKDHYYLDMTDDVVRGSIVLNKGVLSWPPNPPISVAAAAPSASAQKAAAEAKVAAEAEPPNYFNKQLREATLYAAGLSGLNALGVR